MLAFKQVVEMLTSARGRGVECIERCSFELLAVLRSNWQGMLEVADAQASTLRLSLQPDLACRQCFPVRLAKYRQQNLFTQRRVVRLPIDIEKMRVAALTSARQHIRPPRIIGDRGHVVR